MKKKKLKQRIVELESQLGTAKQNEEIWESMFVRLMADLKGYGVKTEIIRAESPVIDVSRTEDDTPKYIHGINTMPPTLSFDFTEHDKNVITNHGTETCEKWRRIWRNMND